LNRTEPVARAASTRRVIVLVKKKKSKLQKYNPVTGQAGIQNNVCEKRKTKKKKMEGVEISGKTKRCPLKGGTKGTAAGTGCQRGSGLKGRVKERP